MADPLAGITGSVNAGLKQTKRQPQFPKGLDQHFGLGPGITGSVNAGLRPPSPKPSFNLGGITGHALAPKFTQPPPKLPSLGRITGSVNAAVGPKPGATRMINGKPVSVAQSERAVQQTLARGQGRVGGAIKLPPPAKALSSKELSKNQLLSLKSAGLGGKNLLAAAGPGLEAMPKKLAAEAVNIPAQVPVAAVKTGIAGVNAIKGHPQELEHLGHEFLNESAVAHLFKGEFKQAFVKAEEHPLGTGLEFSGAGSVADRLAGAIKGTKAVDAASVVSREPRPLPEIMAPKGGVTEPLKPYDKGAIRRNVQEAAEQQPMGVGRAAAVLRRNFDNFEAEELAKSRADRDSLGREHAKLFKKLGSSAEAVKHFTDGLLSDPSILGPDGKPLYHDQIAKAIDRWKDQPRGPDGKPNETITGAEQRLGVLAQLRALQHEHPDLTKAYEVANKIAAQARSKEGELAQHNIATPETIRIAKLVKPFHTHFEDQNPHVDPTSGPGESPFFIDKPIRTPEVTQADQRLANSRGARDAARAKVSQYQDIVAKNQQKLRQLKAEGRAAPSVMGGIVADQNLLNQAERDLAHAEGALNNAQADYQAAVKAQPPIGTTERQQISVDEVAKKLEAKGVHEDQLAFSSTRPFMTEAQALRSGRSLGGARLSTGHLTGYNYLRGHFDPAPEALTRQLQTTTKAINEARGQNEFNRRYPFKAKELAKLIRDRLDRAENEGQVTTLKGYADQLEKQATPVRAKSGKVLKKAQHYFPTLGEAKAAQQHLASLGVPLEPVRIAHPYATAGYREAMARAFNDHADMQDRLEPLNAGEETVHSRLAHPAMPADTAGPWALVHPSIAAKVGEYERNLGSAHLLQMPSSAWRRMNVAFSVRHIAPGGVPQEMGIRMAANNVGVISGIRGTRLMHYLKEWAAQHPDPEVKQQMQRLEAHTGGTIASQTLSQGKHVPLRQLVGTKLEGPMRWWVAHEKQKVTGLPLRAMQALVKVTNKVTNTILTTERKYIEHPPQTAGFGRHAADEFQRIHGQRMKIAGEMNDLEKQFARGLLDPKAVDHAANQFVRFWGDWMTSSPKFRNVQAFIPFLRWYVNSLRFIYHIMPVDHPVKTGMLVAMEQATAEERKLEGQGYQPGTLGFPKLQPGQLPEYQQGSIPIKTPTNEEPGERLGSEYYTPSGAVSGGLEGLLGSLLPYGVGIYDTMQGVDPVTHQPLEEEDPETGRKVPITDKSKLFWKGVLSGAESMVPPYRYASQLLGLGGEAKPAGHVFRPFKTEKEHTVGGKAFEGVLKEELEAAKKGGGKAKKGIPLPKTAMPKTALPKVALPKVTLP